MISKIKKLLGNFGFVSSEIRVGLFLSVVLFSAALLKLSGYSSENIQVKSYDYSLQDSLFYLAQRNADSTPETGRNVEKKVASEQELLDFTDDNFSKRDKPIPKIYEKSININLADKSSLILLPHIGEKTAEKIIEYRSKNGEFKSIEEIKKVKGIGKVKFEKIKKYIEIK